MAKGIKIEESISSPNNREIILDFVCRLNIDTNNPKKIKSGGRRKKS